MALDRFLYDRNVTRLRARLPWAVAGERPIEPEMAISGLAWFQVCFSFAQRSTFLPTTTLIERVQERSTSPPRRWELAFSAVLAMNHLP